MNAKGFTLIELLISMSIIAILSSVVFATFDGLRSETRDTLRKQDIKWFATSLEESINPFTDNYTVISSTTPSIISGVPTPHNNFSPDGVYGWHDNTSNQNLFCVWANLENNDPPYYISNPSGSGYNNNPPMSVTSCDFEIAQGSEEGDGGDGDAQDDEETVAVCHFPEEDPSNFVTLEVEVDDVSTYISLGGHEGECTAFSQPTICYLGVTINIIPIQLTAYLGFGALLGPC